MRRLLPLAVLLGLAAPSSAAVTGKVTLGLVTSQTGAAATLSTTQRQGAQLAVDELNAAHRHGFTLALAERDDASTPDGAKAAFSELISSGVAAILGPTLSASAFAADPLAQAASVPVVAISNTADGITEQGNFVFRASLAERRQIPAAVRVAHHRLKFKRPVMIVRSDQPFAVSGAKAFRAALRKAGVPIVKETDYTGEPEDFSPILRLLAAAQPDVLIIESLTEGPQVMKTARKTPGLKKVALMGGNAFNSLAVIKAAGSAANGLIVGAAWHPAKPTSASRGFVSRFRAKYSATPDQFAAQAYTAVLAVADALGRAPSADGAALRNALAATHGLTSPLGSFGFGPSRNVTTPGIVQIVRNGAFKLL